MKNIEEQPSGGCKQIPMKVSHRKFRHNLSKLESHNFLAIHKFMKRKATLRCISMLLKKFKSNYLNKFWKTVLLKITKLLEKRPLQSRLAVKLQAIKRHRREWIFTKDHCNRIIVLLKNDMQRICKRYHYFLRMLRY